MTKVPVNMNPLTRLDQTIEKHWREHRPTMVAELEAEGKLEQMIHYATEMTKDMVYTLVSTTGCSIAEAWWEVMGDYAILPNEEDVPELGSPPQTWDMSLLDNLWSEEEE